MKKNQYIVKICFTIICFFACQILATTQEELNQNEPQQEIPLNEEPSESKKIESRSLPIVVGNDHAIIPINTLMVLLSERSKQNKMLSNNDMESDYVPSEALNQRRLMSAHNKSDFNSEDENVDNLEAKIETWQNFTVLSNSDDLQISSINDDWQSINWTNGNEAQMRFLPSLPKLSNIFNIPGHVKSLFPKVTSFVKEIFNDEGIFSNFFIKFHFDGFFKEVKEQLKLIENSLFGLKPMAEKYLKPTIPVLVFFRDVYVFNLALLFERLSKYFFIRAIVFAYIPIIIAYASLLFADAVMYVTIAGVDANRNWIYRSIKHGAILIVRFIRTVLPF